MVFALMHDAPHDDGPTSVQPRVVLAEDDPDLRESLRHALTTHGYGVTVVIDGRGLLRSLIRTLDENPHGFVPDVIISEAEMPGYDALEIVRALHRTGSPVPVVLLATECDDALRESFWRAGVFDVIAKPFELPSLVHTVDRAVASVRGAARFPMAPDLET
jgi:two-component system response regulator MprA